MTQIKKQTLTSSWTGDMWKLWAHNRSLKNNTTGIWNTFCFVHYLDMCNKRALAVVPSAWLQKWLKILHTFIKNNLRLHRSQTPLTVHMCSSSRLPLRLTFSLLSYYCWLWLAARSWQQQWAGRHQQALREWNARATIYPTNFHCKIFPPNRTFVFFTAVET